MKTTQYYFAKRLLEVLPSKGEQALSVDKIVTYVLKHEDYLSAKQVKQWLRYYSNKSNSILKKSSGLNAFYLDTFSPKHKLFVEDIIPARKKVYNRISDFSERNQKIIKMYKKGLTLQEIGDEFNLTRERVRQVLLPAIKIGILKKNKRHISEKALKSMKEKGFVRRGTQQKFPDRNAEIANLAEKGYSYSKIANEMEISRSTVCSAMYRYKRRSQR